MQTEDERKGDGFNLAGLAKYFSFKSFDQMLEEEEEEVAVVKK